MDRAGKQANVETMKQSFGSLSAVFAFDYRGLKVEQATEFRRKVRENGAGYKVVKNTLAKRAIRGTDLELLEPHLNGMIGLVYTESDPVSLAKVINDFAKDVPALAFKVGVLADKTLDERQFKALASLPSKEALLSQLLSVLHAPMRNLLSVLNAPARDLILVLKAHEDKVRSHG
ncbi:MAG TPA: 50S ribosomal protein L10 [Vicinamibacteria bacterium]|nr:50S ribosomal protein L10 [Vicinamibacteria bacterium]